MAQFHEKNPLYEWGKMNFDSNAFVCNVNYWEGHLFRHIDYRAP